jgi:hypothetical protein
LPEGGSASASDAELNKSKFPQHVRKAKAVAELSTMSSVPDFW